MKQREKCSGRGFDSRQVHHKHIAVCIRKTDHPGVSMFSLVILQYAFDGPAMVSTGQQVTEWTARQCESRRVGVSGRRSKKRKRKRRTVRIGSLNTA